MPPYHKSPAFLEARITVTLLHLGIQSAVSPLQNLARHGPDQGKLSRVPFHLSATGTYLEGSAIFASSRFPLCCSRSTL